MTFDEKRLYEEISELRAVLNQRDKERKEWKESAENMARHVERKHKLLVACMRTCSFSDPEVEAAVREECGG